MYVGKRKNYPLPLFLRIRFIVIFMFIACTLYLLNLSRYLLLIPFDPSSIKDNIRRKLISFVALRLNISVN